MTVGYNFSGFSKTTKTRDIPYKKLEKRTLFARKHPEGFLLGIERESNSKEDIKTT